MTMQIVNLVQGSPEWHAHRAQHFNASDAPAMMGASSYKSRSELIKELATGITPDIDAATQRRFDDGHQFEALARPLAEQIIGEDLSPCVGTRGKYSASFDGLTFMNDVAFEHKTLNSALRGVMEAGCTGADLPLQYRVQMEQQAMVSGSERILFMASKWTSEGLPVEALHCWYEPDAELRAQIIAGWEQIEKDVAAYQPQAAEPKPQAEAKIRDALPVLRIEARGEITTSTLDSFRVEVLERINSVNAVLETDQQFADADADAKWLRDVSSAMKQAGKKVRSDMQSVDDVLNVLEQLDQIATRKAIDLEKRVKSEKDVRKQVIVQEAQQALDVHVDSLNKQLGTYWLPRFAGGFAETIKGLKSLDSMRDKVAVALTNAKLQAQTTANTLLLNRDFLRSDGSGQDWITLFPDFPAMGVKEPEVFKAMATMRINDFKQAEAERLEAERARIRAEEEAKAKREADAKAAADAAEQARQLEADRARIRAEEQQKAQADAAQQRQQVHQQAQEVQAEISQAAQDGALAAPLASDLSGLVAEQAVESVAGIDAQQAISTAQASAAAAPAADEQEAKLTIGQINARLKDVGLGQISAATLDFHGIPYAKDRGSVQIPVTQVRRLLLLISMGTRKLADDLQSATV
ncbi:YqaJ viral recombinase family protein [Comamonas testosteroni]|uniref:YqaJ viral recombinase family protein n=1 Tax=Comamonas testosteroni TaxID=285 RepID=UPI0006B9A56B|nr:YqaJ viral recombinase family protein [Comamonas testosteroni]